MKISAYKFPVEQMSDDDIRAELHRLYEFRSYLYSTLDDLGKELIGIQYLIESGAVPADAKSLVETRLGRLEVRSKALRNSEWLTSRIDELEVEARRRVSTKWPA